MFRGRGLGVYAVRSNLNKLEHVCWVKGPVMGPLLWTDMQTNTNENITCATPLAGSNRWPLFVELSKKRTNVRLNVNFSLATKRAHASVMDLSWLGASWPLFQHILACGLWLFVNFGSGFSLRKYSWQQKCKPRRFFSLFANLKLGACSMIWRTPSYFWHLSRLGKVWL